MVTEVAAQRAEQRVSCEHDTPARLDTLERRFEQFAVAIRAEIRRRSGDLDARLQPAAFRTLKTLAQLGPVRQSVLGEVLALDKSLLSRHLHLLAELGLIVRTTDADDRRAVIVDVTATARSRLHEQRREARHDFRTALAEWDPEELDELNRLLEKLWRAVTVTSDEGSAAVGRSSALHDPGAA